MVGAGDRVSPLMARVTVLVATPRSLAISVALIRRRVNSAHMSSVWSIELPLYAKLLHDLIISSSIF
jgi:hypothetical protein